MFTEDEKIIARNIDKKFEWMARDKNGTLFFYSFRPVKKEEIKKWGNNSREYAEYVSTILFNRELFKSIKWEDDEPTRISDIYNPQILDEAEREYLKTVLAPFHDEVDYVVKFGDSIIDEDDGDSYRKEYLYIKLYDGQLSFPDFDPGKMYSGMKPDKKYKLEELGITY